MIEYIQLIEYTQLGVCQNFAEAEASAEACLPKPKLSRSFYFVLVILLLLIMCLRLRNNAIENNNKIKNRKCILNLLLHILCKL